MNNEMWPFVFMMLQSDEQKKQILAEIKSNTDPGKIANGIVEKAGSGNLKKFEEESGNFIRTINSLKESVEKLYARLGEMEKNPSYNLVAQQKKTAG